MAVLNSIQVSSATKLSSAGGAVIGLFAGIVYSVGGAIIDALVSAGWVSTDETPGLSFGTILAFGALAGMPLIGAAAGFVVGAFGAWLYNSIAKRLGGLKIDLGGNGQAKRR